MADIVERLRFKADTSDAAIISIINVLCEHIETIDKLHEDTKFGVGLSVRISSPTILIDDLNKAVCVLLALKDRAEKAADEIERLRGALRDAREDVAHWGGYAPQWAQNKHDLAGDLARIDAAIAAEPYQNDYQNDEEKGRPARWNEPPEV